MQKCIYEILNLIDGKTYYGQHRLRENRPFEKDPYIGGGILITRAIEKHGRQNFKKSIVVQGDFTKEEIDRFERCIIRIMRLSGKAEYNLADGGEGGNTSQFIDYDQVSASLKLVKHTDDWNNKVSNGLKKAFEENRGFCHGMQGKHQSEEAKNKISEAMKGNQYGKGYVMSEDEKRHLAEINGITTDEITRRKSIVESYDRSSESWKIKAAKDIGIHRRSLDRWLKKYLSSTSKTSA